MKCLDLTVPFRIGRASVDQQRRKRAHHRDRVQGDEARPVVDEDDAAAAIALQRLVQAPQEELLALRGPDHDVEPEARGIVEEEERDALGASRARPEVLAVAEQELHPVRVGVAAAVVILGLPPAPGADAEPLAGAPERGAVDALGLADHADLSGPADELGQ